MADSLDDLGSIELKIFEANWAQVPKNSFDRSFEVLEFSGSFQEVFSFTEKRPEKFELKLTFETEAEEKEFLEFFWAQKGMWGKFWSASVAQRFTLAGSASNGASFLEVVDNNYQLNSLGIDRIYLELVSGDKLTRKVNSIDDNGDTLNLNLNTVLDRNINVTDICVFSTLHLCRFNTDKVEIEALKNRRSSETTITLIELQQEAAAV